VWLSATRLGSAPQYQWLFRKPLPIWSYATFTQNIFMGRRGGFGAEWLGVTWSLAVEEQFYLFVPLVIYLLPRRLLFYLLVCAVLAAPVLRCLSGDFNNFVNTPWRADSLLSGASLAVLVRWKPFIDGLRDHRLAMRALFGILMAGAAVMTVHPKEFGEFDHFWLAGLYTVFIAIAFAGTEQAMTKVLRFPVLVWLGQLSYGIYMFHQAISGLLHGWLGHGEPQLTSARDIEITLLSLALTLILAAISYYFFEKPILHFGRQFQYLPKLSDDAAARTVQSPL
jgi:peptidoglycan/LPS O-acetylase OafA/YrhL